MEGAGHRRSKSAPAFEGIPPIEKYKTLSRFSPDNALYGNGSSSAGKFMVERGQSSSMRDTERPQAKHLAEKMFKEAESKSSSPSGMARLMRLEGLNLLWNSKQKTGLPDGHRQNNVSVNIEPDTQPRGCLLYKRRMPIKRQPFSEVCDEPEASHFVNHRRSSKWRARSEMGLTRQKIDTKHLSFGELIDLKPEDSNVLDDPLGLQYSNDRLMNYARELDSINVHQQASSSSFHPERMDGLLLERYGAHTSHRTSNTQAEEKKKKKKDVFPRPTIFPRSDIRNIQTAEESGSSSYHSRGNIPNFRKMKEYPGVETSEEISWRMNGSYYDTVPKPISKATRNLAREVTRQLEDARDESEDEMDPGSGLYGARRSNFNREPDMFKLSSRNILVDDNKWGRHQSPGSLIREGNERLLGTLKITRTYRDSDLDDDPRILREVIAVPDGETRYNNLAYRGSDRSSARLGTDSRSSVLDGASSSSPWASSRSRSLLLLEGRVQRRDTCLDVFAEEKHVMQNDPISRGRSRAVKGYPIHNNFLASQGSTSRSTMPLPFPPIRINNKGSLLEATFEIPMEQNVEDLSEEQTRSAMAETDDYGGDTVHDIMIDKQEIATLPSEHSVLHPRRSSEDSESSAADDQEGFSVQGLRYGPPEEGSPSLNQLEAESLFSESSSDADYASPISSFGIPYVEDASFISENFERISAEFNELRMKLQVAYPSSSAESWEDCYTLDVLIQSSFQDFGFDMLPIMWHYPDYPLNPALFDTLEKNYGDASPELRSERLLLFDKINSAISEIFQKHVDLRPWLMPKLGLLPTRVKEPTKDAVENLISQESTNLQIIERILLRDMQWADPVEEFASMGKKIEEILLDDIIAEFVCDLSDLMDVVYIIG